MFRVITIGLILLFFVVLPVIFNFKDRKLTKKLLHEYKIKKDYRREILKLSREIKRP